MISTHTVFDVLRGQSRKFLNSRESLYSSLLVTCIFMSLCTVPERMSAASLIHAPSHPEPPCYVRSKLAGQFSPVSEELTIFDHFTWYNPNGLWAHLADGERYAYP